MSRLLLLLIAGVMISGCSTMNANSEAVVAEPRQEKAPANCVDKLNSNCGNSQKLYFQNFVRAMNRNGYDAAPKKREGEPQALTNLPKDHNGLVNWTLATMRNQVSPKESIGDDQREVDNPFNMVVFFQAKVGLMADVLFPHSVHTYWLSCKNCHPRIFKPQVGANQVTMKAIVDGKFCGRCHGKVAFPLDSEYDCRRCHSQQKRHSGS